MRSLAVLENHVLIADAVGRFVRDRSPAANLVSLSKGDPDWRILWPECAELGLLALAFTEEQGGLGGDAGTIAVAAAALGPGLLASPFIECSVIAGKLLAALPDCSGDAESLITGSSIVTVVDGRHSSRHGISYQAAGEGYRLDGRAAVQRFAAQAQSWLVLAHGDEGPKLFRLAADAPSVRVQDYRLIDAHRAADIEFTTCHVAASALLASGTETEAAADLALRYGRVALCAEAFGIMGVMIEMTAEYLATRIQFGTKIGTFQALQHRFADMQIDYAKAHAALLHACRQIDAGLSPEEEQRAALSAHVVVADAARRIGHEAIQLHGGIGATLEMPTSHFNSRLAAIRRFDGGPDAALVQLSRLNTGI